MKNVNLLIKPASSLCNLRCRYCFYADVAENRDIANLGIMSPEVAEMLVKSAFRSAGTRARVSFAFQGGEPTMAGLGFFKKFVDTVNDCRPAGVQVTYSLQTNGLVVDEDWAEFFHENNFLVGLSIDGEKSLHDFNRVDYKGKGTYSRVTKALALLRKKQVEVNLLCVVTGQCARQPQKVYSALKKLGVAYLQFIPCLDPLEGERGGMAFSLKPAAYGSFLCGLFDAWYHDWESGRYTSVRLFDDYVHLAMGLPPGTCSTSGACGSYFVAEGDGSLYPCDFYVLDQWKLGNVSDGTLEELAASDRAKRFMADGLQKPDACASCKWLRLCGGGCKRDWFSVDGKLENYYCPAFKRFFEHAAQRISCIARAESSCRMNPEARY